MLKSLPSYLLLTRALAVAFKHLHGDQRDRVLDGCLVVSSDSEVDEECRRAGLRVNTFIDMIEEVHTEAGFASLIKEVLKVKVGGFVYISLHWSGFPRRGFPRPRHR